jgi:GNAT superfamily N-acetyltransferase
MEITPLNPTYTHDAAVLFSRNYWKQRQLTPALPDTLENAAVVAARLAGLADGLAAVQDGRLVGFLGWFVLDNFRGTGRRGAYCPEWAHTCLESFNPAAYRALYQAVAARWTEAGCKIHALSLLAYDKTTEKTWFWSGFGLAVVDAIRPMLPLQAAIPQSVVIHKAGVEDAPVIAALDAEHWYHYTTPPVFMRPALPLGPAGQAEFLLQPHNSVWLAAAGADPVGFMRFEFHSSGAAEIVASEQTVAITGAYIRPDLRGQGVATALLAGALRDYAARGFERCAVDFESFNPEAAAFWMRYFEPVSLSVIRHPEAFLA